MASYEEIADKLRARIEAGEFDKTLPSVGALADQYGVAINTIRAAEKLLEAEGQIRISAGKGAYLLDDAPVDPHITALNAVHQAQAALARAERALRAQQE